MTLQLHIPNKDELLERVPEFDMTTYTVTMQQFDTLICLADAVLTGHLPKPSFEYLTGISCEGLLGALWTGIKKVFEWIWNAIKWVGKTIKNMFQANAYKKKADTLDAKCKELEAELKKQKEGRKNESEQHKLEKAVLEVKLEKEKRAREAAEKSARDMQTLIDEEQKRVAELTQKNTFSENLIAQLKQSLEKLKPIQTEVSDLKDKLGDIETGAKSASGMLDADIDFVYLDGDLIEDYESLIGSPLLYSLKRDLTDDAKGFSETVQSLAERLGEFGDKWFDRFTRDGMNGDVEPAMKLKETAIKIRTVKVSQYAQVMRTIQPVHLLKTAEKFLSDNRFTRVLKAFDELSKNNGKIDDGVKDSVERLRVMTTYLVVATKAIIEVVRLFAWQQDTTAVTIADAIALYELILKQ